MFLIKTEVKESLIPNAGDGVFSLQDIKKGQIIWKFNREVDITFSIEEYNNFNVHDKAYHNKYSYRCFLDGKEVYVYCGDNARFMNHSDTPNTDDSGMDTCIALKDIKAGEELTCDYRTFDLDSKEKLDF